MAAIRRARALRIEGRGTTERVAREAADSPVVEHLRPETPIEPDCRLVPVEYGPFHTTAPARDRNRCQMHQQTPPHSTTAPLGKHEEILEVETGPAEERR